MPLPPTPSLVAPSRSSNSKKNLPLSCQPMSRVGNLNRGTTMARPMFLSCQVLRGWTSVGELRIALCIFTRTSISRTRRFISWRGIAWPGLEVGTGPSKIFHRYWYKTRVGMIYTRRGRCLETLSQVREARVRLVNLDQLMSIPIMSKTWSILTRQTLCLSIRYTWSRYPKTLNQLWTSSR